MNDKNSSRLLVEHIIGTFVPTLMPSIKLEETPEENLAWALGTIVLSPS